MHPNPVFHKTALGDVRAFMRDRGFGTLAVNGDPVPVTAHIPFVLEADHLTAHLMASNPIWRMMGDGDLPAVITVLGPDGYISPDWYGHDDQVPTWNYIAARLTGRLKRLPDDQLRAVLDSLSAVFEGRLAGKTPWTMDKMTPDVRDRMMRMIRPVRFEIVDIESTWKLGQNKPEDARLGAAEALQRSGIGLETAVLGQMMKDVRA